MLSQRFEKTIKELFSEKMKTKIYEDKRKDLPEPWCLTNSYNGIFGVLRYIHMSMLHFDSLEDAQSQDKFGQDSNNYTNFIVNTLFNGQMENNGWDDPGYSAAYKASIVNNLKYLDYMTPEAQQFINSCLDVLDPMYILPDIFFEKISNKRLGSMCQLGAILTLHFNRMMQKIHFVWKQQPASYFQDTSKFDLLAKKYQMNYTPMNHFTTNIGLIDQMFERPSDDIKTLIKMCEKLIIQYKNIKLIDDSIVVVTQPQEIPKEQTKNKYTYEELNKYTVVALKQMCFEQKIDTKGKRLKADYINLLLNK